MKRLFMRTRMVLPFALVALGCILVLSGFAYAPAQTQHVEKPLLSPIQCGTSQTLAIYYSVKPHISYTACFAGTGYLGYRLNNVDGYENDSGYYAWVKIYPNGSTNGCYYAIPPYGQASFNAFFDGKHSITQVDVNSRASFSNLCNAV